MNARLVTGFASVVCLAAAYGLYDFAMYIGSESPAVAWWVMWAAALVVVEAASLLYLTLRRAG